MSEKMDGSGSLDLPDGQRVVQIPSYVSGAYMLAYAAVCKEGHLFVVSQPIADPRPACVVCELSRAIGHGG
jgi:hypothetical protein